MDYLWVYLALASAVFFALKDILSKSIMNKNVRPKQIMFEEYFLLFIIVAFLFFPLIDFKAFLLHWEIMLFRGFVLFIAGITHLTLLKKHDISTVAPLLNLSPVFLIFFSWLFLAESLTIMQYIGVFIIIISTYLLEIITHNHKKENPHKFHIREFLKKDYSFHINTFFMLISLSILAIIDKKIFSSGVNVYTNLFFTSIILILVLLVYFIKEKYLKQAIKNIVKEPETLVISLFNNISTFLVLFAIAIPTSMVSLIIPLRRTSTILSSLFGGILFHEKHLPAKISITFLMLIGITLIIF